MPSGSPSSAHSTRISTGATVGLVLLSVVILVVGTAGPVAGFFWGHSLGVAAAGGGHGAICFGTCPSGTGGPAAGPTPDAAATGLTGDLGIVDDAPAGVRPVFEVALGATWKSTDVDGSFEQFLDAETQCVVAIDHGEHFDVDPASTDATESGNVVDSYESGLRDDDAYAHVDDNTLAPRWIQVTGSDARVQFLSSAVYYTDAATGEGYRTDVLSRVMVEPAWLLVVYIDCPLSVGNFARDDLSEAVIAGLSLRG